MPAQWDFRIATTHWLLASSHSFPFWMGVVLSVIFPNSTRVGEDRRERLLVFLVHELSRPRDNTSKPDEEILNLEHDAIAEWGNLGYCSWGGMSHFAYRRERAESMVTMNENHRIMRAVHWLSALWRHIRTAAVSPPWGRYGHVAYLVHMLLECYNKEPCGHREKEAL